MAHTSPNPWGAMERPVGPSTDAPVTTPYHLRRRALAPDKQHWRSAIVNMERTVEKRNSAAKLLARVV